MYIYLFRFMEIFTCLQASCNDKKYLNAKIKPAKIKQSIAYLEILDKQLRERYKVELLLENENSIIPTNEIKVIGVQDIKNKGNISNEGGRVIKKCKNEEGFITCKALYDLITNQNKLSVLIIDIREPQDFVSRIEHNAVINIPSSVIEIGLSANKLESSIPGTSTELWKRREEFDHIVLVDDDTNEKTLTCDKAIFVMRGILMKWDCVTKYKNTPRILRDGIIGWVNTYPVKTIKPNFIIFLSRYHNTEPNKLPDIEYPDSEDEVLIEKILSKPSNEVISVDNPPYKSTSATFDSNSSDQSVTIPPKPFFDRSVKPVLKNNTSVDNSSSRLPLRTIHDLGNNNDRPDNNDSLKQNYQSDSNEKEISEPHLNHVNKYVDDKETESVVPKTGNASSKQIGGDDTLERLNDLKLNFSPSNSGLPGLKKAHSSPNIAKADDDEPVGSPITSGKAPPSLDRSKKPVHLTPDKPRYGMQDRPRITQNELEGAVVGVDIGRGLTGLKNLGNSCYINSVLQCISNTKALREELCKFCPGESFRNNPKSKTEGVVAREVERVLRILWHGNIKYFSCYDLKNALGRFRAAFKGCEQQDSHEFFTILMDWLHEDLIEPSLNNVVLHGAVEDTGEKAWGEFRKNNNSVVMNLFYGQQRSTVECNTCGKKSVTFESFSNLSLLLPSKNQTCNLFECLELYLNEESITGWNCPDCKEPRNATKKVDITRLPPVLVIHFKRFTSNGWCRKKQTFVNFPIENVNMRDFTVDGSEQRDAVYNLYAVSNHYGTTESGHYTAYCHNSELRRWFKFDDLKVTEIAANDVRTPAAYILFYSAIPRSSLAST